MRALQITHCVTVSRSKSHLRLGPASITDGTYRMCFPFFGNTFKLLHLKAMFFLFCFIEKRKIKEDEERPDHLCITSHLLPGNYFQNVPTAKNFLFVFLFITKWKMEHQHRNLEEGKSYRSFERFLGKKKVFFRGKVAFLF